MRRRAALAALVAVALVASRGVRGQSAGSAASAARPDYDVEYLGAPLPDPLMQHNKETFVSFGCAYCHGLTLTPRGEAADLMHSPLVGADVDGSTIVPLLKAGIPQTPKLSPMPQFSDLSDQQLHAIARYIHYARQLGRYRELVQSPPASADAPAGKTFFDEQCAGCHAADLNGIGRRYDAAGLRDRMLMPKASSAQPRHNALLENYTPAQVANLVAYLQTR